MPPPNRKLLAKGLEKEMGSGHAMVAEHRGLLTALGVAMVTIGLGGIVSLQVGKALADRRLSGVEGVELLCVGIIVVGIAILGTVLWSLKSLREFNQQLGIFVAEGGMLLHDSWGIEDDDEEKTAAFQERVADWVADVARYLGRRDIAKAAHFRNDAGQILVVLLYGSRGMNGQRVELETRLMRLGELMPVKT